MALYLSITSTPILSDKQSALRICPELIVRNFCLINLELMAIESDVHIRGSWALKNSIGGAA